MPPGRYPGLPALALAAVVSALLVATAAAGSSSAVEGAAYKPPPGILGRGVDKRPIFRNFNSYIKWCGENPNAWPYKGYCTQPKGYKPFNQKLLPKGVHPVGACTGKPMDTKPRSVPTNRTLPVPVPPQKRYQPAKSKGTFGQPWGLGKNAVGRRLMAQLSASSSHESQTYHARATRRSTGSGARFARSLAEQCPGLACVTDLPTLDLSFSLPLKIGDSTVDLGKVLDPSGIVNDFLGLIGKTICDLSFPGSAITSGTWLGELFGDPTNAAAQQVASLVPLFDAMALRQDVNFLIMGFPLGVPPITPAAGANPSDFNKIKGVMSKGVAIALNPCTLDIFFQFKGFEAGPFQLGNSGLELTLAANAFGFSNDGAIPSNLEGMGMNRVFWTPTGFRNVPTAAPTGHLYFDGSGAIAPSGSSALEGILDMSLEGNLKLLVNVDPLKNSVVGNPSSFADFQVLANANAAPSVTIGGVLPLDLSAIFEARSNLYTGFDNTGFTFAASLNITRGGLGDLLGKLTNVPDPAKSAVNAIFSQDVSLVELRSVAVYAAADGWGVRVQLGTGTTGVMAGFGVILDLLRLAFPTLPSRIEPTFAIMGKSQGNGLPIGVQMGLAGVGQQSFYFCSSSSQCPAGSSCQLGLCATTTCGEGTFPTSAITCSVKACPPGFISSGPLTCIEVCKPGEVDQGATCASCGTNQYDAGLCYTPCKSGYYNVGPVCWQRCGAGYRDGGALCTLDRPAFGKGCCCTLFGCCGCPNGFTDIGCICAPSSFWKSSYGRGAGSLPTIRTKRSLGRVVVPKVTLPP